MAMFIGAKARTPLLIAVPRPITTARTARLQALNRVAEHVGLEDAVPFTADMIAGISGYTGHYNRTLDPASEATMATLKSHFTQPSDDLQRLLDTYFPELEFQGLASDT